MHFQLGKAGALSDLHTRTSQRQRGTGLHEAAEGQESSVPFQHRWKHSSPVEGALAAGKLLLLPSRFTGHGPESRLQGTNSLSVRL